MNDTPILLHKSQISMSKVLNKEKLNIIKMGFLNKRSKYLKMWNKFNILKSRRYIILTNKNMFSFINDEKSADCTMNLKIINCSKVEISDDEINKENTFVLRDSERNYYFQADNEFERNKWVTSIRFSVSNPGIVNEQDEIDYMNDPDRTYSMIIPDK